MAIGLPGLAAIGMATDFATTAYGNRLQTRAAHEAQDFSAQQFAHRYQTQVADLKAAGLNPMLAYGQSPGSAPSGVMAQQKAPESAQRYNETILASAQSHKIKQETINLQSENENIKETLNKIKHEIYNIRTQSEEIDQRRKTGKATEEDIREHAELNRRLQTYYDLQTQLALQQKNINTPEEIASGTTSAQNAAYITRALDPLIKAISGLLGAGGAAKNLAK